MLASLIVLIAAGCSAAAPPAPAAADVIAPARKDAAVRAAEIPLNGAGGYEWSAFAGFGINQVINGSAAGIDIGTAGVRVSRLWGEQFGSFLRGHPAVALELVPLMAFVRDGGNTLAVGTNLVYEHHFAARGRVLPVWQIGAGFLYADDPVPDGETQHNFSVLTGLGVEVLLGNRSAVSIGYRFHHVSNANTGNVNPGVNAHSVILGVSFYR